MLLLLEALGVVIASRTFAAMFRDFGGTLPLVTRLFLMPVVPLGAALGAMALAVEGALRRRSEPAMLARVIIEIVVAGAIVIGFVVGMYAPIFAISGSVSP
ncbi:MAG: hypothetical protein JNM17_06625 [Archangium sp.]|nr:hypothetical protein [Archangium sp.]